MFLHEYHLSNFLCCFPISQALKLPRTCLGFKLMARSEFLSQSVNPWMLVTLLFALQFALGVAYLPHRILNSSQSSLSERVPHRLAVPTLAGWDADRVKRKKPMLVCWNSRKGVQVRLLSGISNSNLVWLQRNWKLDSKEFDGTNQFIVHIKNFCGGGHNLNFCGGGQKYN